MASFLGASMRSPKPTQRRSIAPNMTINGADATFAAQLAALGVDSKESSSEENVCVLCRVRPFNQREIEIHNKTVEGKPAWEHYPLRSIVEFAGSTCSFLDAESDYVEKERFAFDSCLWSIPFSMQESENDFATQETLFNLYGEQVLEHAWRGYNTCFFAYGQTGSGKTHSMMGTTEDSEYGPADPGLIPRLCKRLFEQVDANIAEADAARETQVKSFRVSVQYMEIYNEMVKDLLWNLSALSPEAKAKLNHENLKIRTHPQTGVFVEHLTAVEVNTWQQMVELIEHGNNSRATAATKMNERSSRSHAIFKITLTQITTMIPKKQFEKPTEHIRESSINLVDLAGSERNKKTGATGDRLKEAASINKSLSTLKSVIDALVDNCTTKGPKKRIPYRDSHLTSILMDSIGGNSKTFMLVTLSPHLDNAEETLQTLKYGSKARQIVSTVHVNENAAGRVLLDLEDELKRMKMERERAEAEGENSEAAEELQAQILQSEQSIQKLQEEMDSQTEKMGSLAMEKDRHQRQRQIKAVENLEVINKISARKTAVAAEEMSLRRKVSSMSKDMSGIQQRINEVEVEIDFAAQRIEELEVKRSHMESEMDHMRKRSTKHESLRWELQKKVDDLKRLMQKIGAERIGMLLKKRLEIARLKVAFRKRKAERESEHGDEIDKLRQQLKRQNDDIEFDNRMLLADLENERDGLKRDLHSLRAELVSVEGERERQIETLEQRVSTLQVENKRRKEALASRVSALTHSWEKRYNNMVHTMERQYSELMDECRKHHQEEEEKLEVKLSLQRRKNADELRKHDEQKKAHLHAEQATNQRSFDDAKRHWERSIQQKRDIMEDLRKELRRIEESEKGFSTFHRRTAVALEMCGKPGPDASPAARELHSLLALFHGQYEADKANIRQLHSLLTHDVNNNRCSEPPTLGLVIAPTAAGLSNGSLSQMERRNSMHTNSGGGSENASPSPSRARSPSLRRINTPTQLRRIATDAVLTAGSGDGMSPSLATGAPNLSFRGRQNSWRAGSVVPPSASKEPVASGVPGAHVARRSTTPVRSALFFSTRIRTKSPSSNRPTTPRV